MNTNNVELALWITMYAMFGLSMSVCIGSWALHKLTAKKPLTTLHLFDGKIVRRAADSKPGIVCSLPIHQQSPLHEILPPI